MTCVVGDPWFRRRRLVVSATATRVRPPFHGGHSAHLWSPPGTVPATWPLIGGHNGGVKIRSDAELETWVPPHPSASAVLASVLARYDEPHRHYHDGRHVRMVVSRCLELMSDASVRVADAHALVWAALWHDAIYDPRAHDNEAASARLAVEQLGQLGVVTERLSEVSRLIVLTAGHGVERSDADGAVLVDADLAVLGASPDAYADYVRGVRAEYHFVNDDAWRVGRANVLTNLLALPHLFHTPPMLHREATARSNLAAELAQL